MPEWTEDSEPAQDSGFVEDVEPSTDTFDEDDEPAQDSLFLAIYGFGHGSFGHILFGHSVPEEGRIY